MDSLGRRQGSLDRLIGILVFVWDLGHQCRRVGEAGVGGGHAVTPVAERGLF